MEVDQRSAGTSEGQQEALDMQLLDVPLSVARDIALVHALDGDTLARLSMTCRFWRQVAADQTVWHELLLERFGPEMIPQDAPRPEQLDRWVFFRGYDAPGNDARRVEGAPGPRELAHEAEVDQERGFAPIVAFNTAGYLKTSVPRPEQWRHTSYEPGQGMYVRSHLVEQWRAQGAAMPAMHDADVPPQLPGWTFYPGWLSPGHDVCAPDEQTGDMSADFTARCRTLRSLADEARGLFSLTGPAQVVAFTTQGRIKSDLQPVEHWQYVPSTWHGMWVRDEVVQQKGLPLPAGETDYRKIYARLSRLRKAAATEMDVVWLNDHYLRRAEVAGSCSPQVVVLNSVCWLDLGAEWKGVPPGRYTLVWRMCLMHARTPHMTLDCTCDLNGARVVPSAASGAAAAAAAAVAAAAAGGSGRTGAAGASGSGAAASTSAAAGQQQHQQHGGAGGGADDQITDDADDDYDGSDDDGQQQQHQEQAGDDAGAPRRLLHRTLHRQELDALARGVAQGAVHQGRWFEVEVGSFQLAPGRSYDITARMFNHDGSWKMGLAWDCVELRRVREDGGSGEAGTAQGEEEDEVGWQRPAAAAAAAPAQSPGRQSQQQGHQRGCAVM